MTVGSVDFLYDSLVSNLPFLGKIIEKVVASQLQQHLTSSTSLDISQLSEGDVEWK